MSGEIQVRRVQEITISGSNPDQQSVDNSSIEDSFEFMENCNMSSTPTKTSQGSQIQPKSFMTIVTNLTNPCSIL